MFHSDSRPAFCQRPSTKTVNMWTASTKVIKILMLLMWLFHATCASLADVRLIGGRAPNEGRVEVRRPDNGQWGRVCADGWNYNAANVVCRSLGYPSAIRKGTGIEWGDGAGLPYAMTDVKCSLTDNRLSNCKHRGWGVHNCSNGEAAGVECAMNVRLADGGAPNKGRLEVLRPDTGEWGLVCDDFFKLASAHVACVSLGYPYAKRPSRLSEFGNGNLSFALDDVACKGTEKHLSECKHSGWGMHNCRSHEAAGVVCTDTKQPSVDRICRLPLETGSRGGVRWHYNYSNRECKPFNFTGCNGNQNNFKSKTECEEFCGHND